MSTSGVKIFVVNLVIIWLVYGQECPQISDPEMNCFCDSQGSSGWQLMCLMPPDYEASYTIEYTSSKRVTILCRQINPYKHAMLLDYGLREMDRVTFKFCPLPNDSFANLLDGSKVRILGFQNGNEAREIDSSVFLGLENSLEQLSLSGNSITSLPDNIFQVLTKLQIINLQDNDLSMLPENIFWKLSNLTYLDLSANSLTYLPEKIFQNVSNLEIVYLYKNRLDMLPSDVFKGLENLKMVDLSENYLTNLPVDLFAKTPNLTTIRLKTNFLTTLSSKLFGLLPELKILDISQNQFNNSLPGDLFQGLNKMESIYINYCHMTSIPPQLFSPMINIKHINLWNNRLTNLPVELFRNNTKLEVLDMSFNDLTELPQEAFVKNENLKELILFKNNLTDLSKQLFKYNKNLKILKLGSNFLTEILPAHLTGLKSLQKLDLSNNNISSFSLEFHFKIKEVDISKNNLKEIPNLEWSQYLEIEMLNMEYNLINFANIPVFYSRNQTKLYLGSNNISRIDIHDIVVNNIIVDTLSPKERENYAESIVYLNDNPLNCDCNFVELHDYLNNNYKFNKQLVRFASEDLICSSPPEISGKLIMRVNKDDLVCPLIDECPVPCTCLYRKHDSTIIVNCSNLNMNSLPSSVPVNTSILYLHNNNIVSVKSLNEAMWSNITVLNIDNNTIETLNDWSTFPSKMVKLSLRGNRLTEISDSLMKFAPKHPELKILLGENPWDCNCSSLTFKLWMTEIHNQIEDYSDVFCGTKIKLNESLSRSLVVKVPDDVMCPIDKSPYRVQLISVTTICVILALLLFIVSVLYYRNKQTVIAYVYIHFHNFFICFFNEQDLDEDKIYDAFVSYSSADRDIAMNLLSQLENRESNFKLCIHERDWMPGNLISLNIVNSVQNSKRTILILSKDFLESMWFQVEFHTAYYQMLEDRIDRLIVIVKGELPDKETLDKDLQFLLSTKTYLVWGERWFWEKLRYAMPHKSLALSSGNKLSLPPSRPNTDLLKTVESQIAVHSVDKAITPAKQQNGGNINHAFSVTNNNSTQMVECPGRWSKIVMEHPSPSTNGVLILSARV